MKLLIALNNNLEENSALSEHFGHCPFFAIYETENNKLEIVKNVIDHANQNQTPVDQVMKFNPDKVFSLGIGQRAIQLFKEKGIELLTGDFKKLGEVIENISSLKSLTQGCEH